MYIVKVKCDHAKRRTACTSGIYWRGSHRESLLSICSGICDSATASTPVTCTPKARGATATRGSRCKPLVIAIAYRDTEQLESEGLTLEVVIVDSHHAGKLSHGSGNSSIDFIILRSMMRQWMMELLSDIEQSNRPKYGAKQTQHASRYTVCAQAWVVYTTKFASGANQCRTMVSPVPQNVK
jgi:hypothetical protein